MKTILKSKTIKSEVLSLVKCKDEIYITLTDLSSKKSKEEVLDWFSSDGISKLRATDEFYSIFQKMSDKFVAA